MNYPACGKKYRHYKGKEYFLLMIGKNSENPDEELCIYQAAYGHHEVWVRPLKMWDEEVQPGIKRFTLIKD